MSGLTQRLRALPGYLPAFLRPAPAAPELIDGMLELERAYQIMQLLNDLPETSQARVLWHVEQISIENARRRAEFAAAEEQEVST